VRKRLDSRDLSLRRSCWLITNTAQDKAPRSQGFSVHHSSEGGRGNIRAGLESKLLLITQRVVLPGAMPILSLRQDSQVRVLLGQKPLRCRLGVDPPKRVEILEPNCQQKEKVSEPIFSTVGEARGYKLKRGFSFLWYLLVSARKRQSRFASVIILETTER